MLTIKCYASHFSFPFLPFPFYERPSIWAHRPKCARGLSWRHVLNCNPFLSPNKSFLVTKQLVDIIFQLTARMAHRSSQNSEQHIMYQIMCFLSKNVTRNSQVEEMHKDLGASMPFPGSPLSLHLYVFTKLAASEPHLLGLWRLHDIGMIH